MGGASLFPGEAFVDRLDVANESFLVAEDLRAENAFENVVLVIPFNVTGHFFERRESPGAIGTRVWGNVFVKDVSLKATGSAHAEGTENAAEFIQTGNGVFEVVQVLVLP